MTFSSISFIYLYLPLAIIIFRLTPAHRRVACLTLLSWCYYLLASVPAALILAANCLLDFVLLSFLELYLARCPDKPVGYLAFAAKAVVVQILVMAYSHWSPGASLGGFVYTATLIGYLWDHSRGKAGYFRSFWDYALFTTFFAKSYLGPVVRYDRFVPQFSQLRSSATLISRGAVQFVIGLAKKVIIADGAVILYQELASLPVEEYTFFSAWMLVFAAAMAIFFTISAYGDMARGLCSIFSLEVPRVIYYPYQAKSVVECVSRINMPLYDLVVEIVSGSAERIRQLRRYRHADTRELIAVLAGVVVVGIWFDPVPQVLLWAGFLFLMVLAERYLYFWLFRYIPGLLQSAVTFGLFLFSLAPLVLPQFPNTGDLISVLLGFSAQRMISDETSYYLASNYLVILLSLLFFTSLADRLTGFLSQKFPVASEWVIAVFNGSLLILTTALLV